MQRQALGTLTRLKLGSSLPRRSLLALTATIGLQPSRFLHATRPLFKKGKKQLGKQETKRTVENAAQRSAAANDDPYDFSDLEKGIENCVARLKSELEKIGRGGRLKTETIEELKVEVKNGANLESLRLSELAQVVPRGGREVVLMVGEASHVKPITSALLNSPHSLNPTPSKHSPLELHVPIPPPTAESRQQAAAAVTKAAENAASAVRQTRGSQQKRLRAMQLAKTARPDDLKRAGDRMEKIVEEGNKEVKRIAEAGKKAIES